MQIQSEQAIANVLRTVPMLRDLDEETIADLAKAASLSELLQDEVVFQEKDAADGIYLVVKGSIRLTCEVSDSPDIVVGYIEAGGILGEMAFLDPAPRSATARAADPTVILYIPNTAMMEFLDSGHAVARVLLSAIRRMMTQRIRVLNERIGALFLIDTEVTEEIERKNLTEMLRGIWSAVRSGG